MITDMTTLNFKVKNPINESTHPSNPTSQVLRNAFLSLREDAISNNRSAAQQWRRLNEQLEQIRADLQDENVAKGQKLERMDVLIQSIRASIAADDADWEAAEAAADALKTKDDNFKLWANLRNYINAVRTFLSSFQSIKERRDERKRGA